MRRVRGRACARPVLNASAKARWAPWRGGWPNLAEVDEAVDRSQHMVDGHMLFELKLIEQSTPIDLPLTHHHLHSASITGVNHYNNPAAASDQTFGRVSTSAGRRADPPYVGRDRPPLTHIPAGHTARATMCSWTACAKPGPTSPARRFVRAGVILAARAARPSAMLRLMDLVRARVRARRRQPETPATRSVYSAEAALPCCGQSPSRTCRVRHGFS
jgi:hypothetical protein